MIKSFLWKSGLCLLSALCYICSYPMLNLWILGFLVYVPLFFIVKREKRYFKLFLWGALTGILTTFGGFYWLGYTIAIFGEFDVVSTTLIFTGFALLFSLKFPVFMMLSKFILRYSGDKLSKWLVLLLPAAYVSTEFWVFELFPWYLGGSQSSNLVFSQIVDVTGIYGLSFLLCMSAYAAYRIVQYLIQKKKSGDPFPLFQSLIAAGLVLVTTIYGIICFSSYSAIIDVKKSKGETITAALVQPNTPLGFKGDQLKNPFLNQLNEWIGLKYERYEYEQAFMREQTVGLSEKALKEHGDRIDVVIWPESAFSFSYLYDKQRNNGIGTVAEEIDRLVSQHQVPFYFNDSIYQHVQVGNTTEGRGYNHSILLIPDGTSTKIAGEYNKRVLLAFGEYMPFRDLIPAIKEMSRQTGNIYEGTDTVVLKTEKFSFAPQICYEIIIPHLLYPFMKQQPDFIFSITNDTWYGITKESWQHLALMRFRAIENRRSVARATKSGISTSIDPVGRYGHILEVGKRDYLIEELVKPPIEWTFYMQFGDVFAWLCSFVTMAVLVLAFVNKRKAKRKA